MVLGVRARGIVIHLESDENLKKDEREVCRALKEKAIAVLSDPKMVGRLEQVPSPPGAPPTVRSYICLFDTVGANGSRIIQ
jgi:hypothetical protein